MNKHDSDIKGFVWYSETWYSKNIPLSEHIKDKLTIGFYSEEGGTSGEFQMDWEYLSGEVVMRLKAYNDGWSALVNMPELLEYMKDIDNQNIPIEQFVKKLIDLGFKDRTKREYKGN